MFLFVVIGVIGVIGIIGVTGIIGATLVRREQKIILNYIMPNAESLDSVLFKEFILEWEKREKIIDKAFQVFRAILTPCPNGRSNILAFDCLDISYPLEKPECEILRIDGDHNVRVYVADILFGVCEDVHDFGHVPYNFDDAHIA